MDCPTVYGPAVVNVLTSETSADTPVALPALEVLLARFGSFSTGVAVALLLKGPAALIVAVTVIVVFPPGANDGIVNGSAAQPLPVTFVIVRFVGVSVTWIDVAVD